MSLALPLPSNGAIQRRKGFLSSPVLFCDEHFTRPITDCLFSPLPRNSFDGASLPPAYQPPEYTGPEPTAEIEGAKLYTGSCHCGAVRVALKSKPLDKTYDESILDCSCSHCRKVRPLSLPLSFPFLHLALYQSTNPPHPLVFCLSLSFLFLERGFNAGTNSSAHDPKKQAGVTWIYPLKEQVVITGVENQVRYTFNTRTWAKAFCRTCGVLVDNHLADVPAEHLAALSEPVRAFVLANAHRHPINLRVLHGVHRDDVNVARIDGFARPPIYEEP